ncbi:hypothetical protein [Rhizobium phaseoli]|uniref:hypothetical protein n=1 Tax=Rhizobium phaseoli TaxID=396 RepID=UPI002555DAF4|nr:hypothetical protein [Rhizobium phaseoli]MDK4727451.1 hypothetical protein [Rhizobium phaseoli]
MSFTPTVDADGNPTTCLCCGMRAVSLGVNPNPKQDPGYLCKRCIVAIDDYKKIRRLDDFEIKALDAGVDAVGEWIAENGGLTELAHYDELMQRLLVKAAWEGCARGLRAALAEAPF